MSEPQFRLTQSFLAQCYAAETGKDMAEAAETAAYFLALHEAYGLITRERVEQAEQDAKILDLRGKTSEGRPITAGTIAFRLSIARISVFKAIRRRIFYRRDALRVRLRLTA